MKQHLLLGTAGHIDHGKTSLVQALTGVDTDRLPEEKQRQITIDIGFASLELEEYSIGIVDVPGHERFVKNMLAGAAGVDLAMLVVAADDSVKPQTREHLDILKYLRLKTGIIALTKCDLVEPDWIELVEAEIRELTEDTFLSNATIVRVSARTGDGLNELRESIAKAAQQVAENRPRQPADRFLMAVDRVFTVAGHGTVVTGSVASGVIRVGDELELQPQARAVRVRGLQSHDTSVEQLGRGQRAAINLGGVHYDEISRGQSLATCGALRASRLLTIELEINDHHARDVKDRSAVRLHLGTASIPGKLSLMGQPTVEPGATVFAQIFLSQEVATAWGQPLVIRGVSPVETLGGGRVLDPLATRIKRLNDGQRHCFDALASDDPFRRAAAAVRLAEFRAWQPDDLSVLAGVDAPRSVIDALLQQQTFLSYRLGKEETIYLHHEVVEELWRRVAAALDSEHRQTPLRKVVERSRLARHFPQLTSSVFDALCASWMEQGELVEQRQGLALAHWEPQLTESQRALLQEIEQQFLVAEFQPPSLDQLAKNLGQPTTSLAELTDVAVEARTLIRLSQTVFLHLEHEQRVRSLLNETMADGKALSVSEIRELLGTTRKIAVPLCEYFDSIGFTRRQGDLRRLVVSKGAATNNV